MAPLKDLRLKRYVIPVMMYRQASKQSVVERLRETEG